MDLDSNRHENSEGQCGCACTDTIKQLKRTDQIAPASLQTFYRQCRKFIVGVLQKLKDRIVVGLPFLKKVSCLDPAKFLELGKDRSIRRFTRLVQYFTGKKIISSSEGDESIAQYVDLVSSSTTEEYFRQFKPDKRLDDFYFDILGVEENYKALSGVLQAVFVLHNGQGEVERGFSHNKEVLATNMGELTIISRRMVKDHMVAGELLPSQVELSPALLRSVKSSRTRYEHHLEKQKAANEAAFGDANSELKKVQEQKKDLISLKNSLNRDFEKYSLEACEQKDFDKMKALLEKGKAVKRKAESVAQEILSLEVKVSALKSKKKKMV